MQRNEEKLDEWRTLLEERKQRNITIKEFCQEKKITPSQFYYYQERINKPEKFQATQKADHSLHIKPIQIVNTTAKENTVIRFILQRKKRPVRKALPQDLPREQIIHDIKDGEKICACGEALTRIGEESLSN